MLRELERMLTQAERLLILKQQQIDALLADDERIQQFLHWVNQKSESVNVAYKPVVLRAFYFAHVLNPNLDRNLDLALDRNFALPLMLDRNFALDRILTHALGYADTHAYGLDQLLDRALNRAHDLALDRKLLRSLEQLKQELPNPQPKNWQTYKQWWQENGLAWAERLRAVMIEHRNIGHDWQFSETQLKLLQQYYAANQLLVDRLKSDCDVSREVREEIEATLLLPVKKEPADNRKV